MSISGWIVLAVGITEAAAALVVAAAWREGVTAKLRLLEGHISADDLAGLRTRAAVDVDDVTQEIDLRKTEPEDAAPRYFAAMTRWSPRRWRRGATGWGSDVETVEATVTPGGES